MTRVPNSLRPDEASEAAIKAALALLVRLLAEQAVREEHAVSPQPPKEPSDAA